jgi:hypothetical protein
VRLNGCILQEIKLKTKKDEQYHVDENVNPEMLSEYREIFSNHGVIKVFVGIIDRVMRLRKKGRICITNG